MAKDVSGSNRSEIAALKRQVDAMQQQLRALIASQQGQGKKNLPNPILFGRLDENIAKNATGTVSWWYRHADGDTDSGINHEVKNDFADLLSGVPVLYVKIDDAYTLITGDCNPD